MHVQHFNSYAFGTAIIIVTAIYVASLFSLRYCIMHHGPQILNHPV